MKRVLSILVIASLFWFSICWPTIINIPADYPTIQQGIDAGADGDTVLVQPGTYYENINFNGHNIVLGSLFLTTGDTDYIEQTIIDGDSSWIVVVFDNSEDSTAVLTGFTIQHGLSQYIDGTIYGGGIHCENSNPRIIHNTITDNYHYNFFGAGILCESSNPLIANNLIVNNSSAGISCRGASNMRIIQNTLCFNLRGIECFQSSPEVINSILWYNLHDEIVAWSGSPTIRYCNIRGNWIGIGNFEADPLFRDQDNGDFRLMSTLCEDLFDSPCIDAGDSNILDIFLDCSRGLGDLRSDMGAYGGGDSAIYHVIPDRFVLMQNYPNPFNASTNIEYGLPKTGHVRINVYDLLGRHVKTIIDEYMQAGVHAVNFDASLLSSGFYFYRLQAGDVVETKRMVLLK